MGAAAARPQDATSGLTALSHRLSKQFSAAADGEGSRAAGSNLVFSPLSIHSALSLVAAGAQGKTLHELLDVLGAGSRHGLEASVRGMVEQAFPPEAPLQGGGPRLSYACGVWHDSSRALKPAYRDVAAASFRSVVRAVNFLSKPEEARKEINSWVAKATNNLIDKILDRGSVDKATRIVVTNAVYFKGSWMKPFDKSMTKEDKFHRLDGSVVGAQFMSTGAHKQFIGVHHGFKVLKMPYSVSGNLFAEPRDIPPRYSMWVLLPDARDGLWSLEDKVASSPSFLRDHRPERAVEVGDFRVPKFRLSFSASVKQALQGLGVQAVFSTGAELPDMLEDDDEPLWVADVVHKAVIEVNEEGTEAAAATAACGLIGSCLSQRPPPPPVDFVADHPFAFFVAEEVSGAILFAGHVLDPTRS